MSGSWKYKQTYAGRSDSILTPHLPTIPDESSEYSELAVDDLTTNTKDEEVVNSPVAADGLSLGLCFYPPTTSSQPQCVDHV